jgi:hypothetical protein
MITTATYDLFLEACRLEGCPICRVEHDADLRYLDRLFYGLVNDYNTRVRVRASLGFCGEHARMAMDEIQGKALGLTIIYDDLLRVALEHINNNGNLRKNEKKCPACENRDEMNGRVLSELSKYITDAPILAAFRTSQGLCFGHLRQALEHLRSAEKRKAILTIQCDIMQELRGELAEFIRKNDYRFAGEGFGAEKDSWKRAVRMGKQW